MIRFSKLRLHGFKSFAERTEVEIGPGLTGIVGPNGCGKSNIVEALRWSMGESSAKRMRGGDSGMEDVIFGGTERRPARNMAEVSVLLDNSDRDAPDPYNNGDEIEVVRRIEKDRGSAYTINGKPVRARDVQILYADILSGANSPYLVSQGRVSALINAKPAERRLILEEAAGITGLHARRHEAELRLRAADANLKRLEDLLGSMEGRLAALKKQARQAARYRNLNAAIRDLDKKIAAAEWRAAHEKLQETEKMFGEAESAVAEHLTAVTQLSKTQETQAEDLPALRQKDAQIAAMLQTKRLALQRLEDEAQRLAAQAQEIRQAQEQAVRDHEHETQALEDYTRTLERQEIEEKTLLKEQESAGSRLEEAATTRDFLREKAEADEAAFTALRERAAAARAEQESIQRQLERDRNRRDQLAGEMNALQEALNENGQSDQGQIDSLRQAVETAEKEVDTERQALQALESDLEKVGQVYEEKREAKREAAEALSRLEAEISALESVTTLYKDGAFRPVMEDMQADDGFEIALSRALGDALTASLEVDAPVIWTLRKVKDLPSLPEGCQPLASLVKAPEALKLALSQIGIVETDEEGGALSPHLNPGQSLVSKDGALWRWDGLSVKTSAPDRHAAQLKHKNALISLQKRLPKEENALKEAESKLITAQNAQEKAKNSRFDAQNALKEAENGLQEKRQALHRLVEENAETQTRRAKQEEAAAQAQAQIEALNTAIAEAETALSGFDTQALEAQQEEIEMARSVLSESRAALQEAVAAYEVARQEQERRKARLQAIGDERVTLQNRSIRARERLKELAVRDETLKERAAAMQDRPASIEEEREALMSRIAEVEKEKTEAADALAVREGELAETGKALKQAEAALSEAREKRAGAQATAQERRAQIEDMERHIRENFEVTPQALSAETGAEEAGDPAELRTEREKAARDRDAIGPVNLQAETEVAALETELAGVLSERDDLTAAIEELRGGIRTLNKEARERLAAAFDHVNAHFREMFTRLFGGGQAHLSLIEAEDPLEAGLEIFAQPPGKKLQSLTLLSGGEQALTAVGLIFAMFLTNPAPICVLDEVDAPLDDANVDRFCDMLEEFAEKGSTRFLVITHHRLTMARMDRLYGVTMAEKGVSQLVSVDLSQPQLDLAGAA